MSVIPLGDADLEGLLATRLGLVEERLVAAVASTDILVGRTSRHLVEAGGKRLRPLLTLLTAELGEGGRAEVLDAAVVVELTHLASLYHDDVMDSAPLRRGSPSAHTVYGNSVAILTGDLLFAKASRVVAGLGPEAVRIQAATFERLCLGQIHETVGPLEAQDPIAHHLGVLADKTGSLIATSARFGALLAGCPPEVVSAVVAYGEKVGVAFQLADDIIDLVSDAELTGKTPGTDLRDGIPTMPVLLLRAEAARERSAGQTGGPAVRLVRAIDDGDLADDAALAEVVAGLRDHPVMDKARAIARQWAVGAVAELTPLPDLPAKTALSRFADLFVSRLA